MTNSTQHTVSIFGSAIHGNGIVASISLLNLPSIILLGIIILSLLGILNTILG